jgi:hypothetical protein
VVCGLYKLYNLKRFLNAPILVAEPSLRGKGFFSMGYRFTIEGVFSMERAS